MKMNKKVVGIASGAGVVVAGAILGLVKMLGSECKNEHTAVTEQTEEPTEETSEETDEE